MARIQRDNFHGGWRVTGLENDLYEAQKHARFRNDLNNISARTVNDLQNVPRDAVATSAAIIGGGIGVGIGMVRNRRFRYIMQAILHFPMAFIVLVPIPAALAATSLADQPTATDAMIVGHIGLALLVPFVGALIWTIAYILLRTRPKIRALSNY